MKTKTLLWVVVSSAFWVACSDGRRGNTKVDGGVPNTNLGCISGSSPENDPTACGDGVDNDCDGLIDCADPNCSGLGACPVCGMITHPLSTPLALPDGVGDTVCTTDANCPTGQLCYDTPMNMDGNPKECRKPYTSKLNFTGFGPTQTLDDVSNIQSVCATMEHSWMRDLHIDLVAPTGEVLQLDKFLGQTGTPDEIYMGKANDCDQDGSPVPGTGAMYCWKPTATKKAMLPYANANGMMDHVSSCLGNSVDELPAGDYQAAGAWIGLLGATLNGDWEIRVADLWPMDNGYIFGWSIAFDPTIVQDCSGPPVQ